jgi:uncharacterized protein
LTSNGVETVASSAPPEDASGPVTTTVTRRVKPGHEQSYDQFLSGIIAAASEFPGHLGVEVFRPESASAGEYRIVYRFDTAEHLRNSLDSNEHAAWLERAEPHVIGPMRRASSPASRAGSRSPAARGHRHRLRTRWRC